MNYSFLLLYIFTNIDKVISTLIKNPKKQFFSRNYDLNSFESSKKLEQTKNIIFKYMEIIFII